MKELTDEELAEFRALCKQADENIAKMTHEEKWADLFDDTHLLAGDPLPDHMR